MKVLHIIPNLAQGGAERILHSLSSVPSQGISHRIVVMEDVSFFDRSRLDIISLGFDLSQKTGSVFHLLRAIRRLRGIVAADRPDIVQGWLYYGNFLTMALQGLNIPIIWSIHNATLPHWLRNPTVVAIDQFLSRASRSVPQRIVYCAEAARRTHEARGYLSTIGVVIPNGVDLNKFKGDRSRRPAIRARMGLGLADIAIGMIARYDPQKDIPGTLAAFAMYSRMHSGTRLVLAGRGMVSSNTELCGLLEKEGIRDRAGLLGEVNDVDAMISGLDVVMLGSKFGEALPMVLLEALVSNVPIVSTRLGDVDLLPVPSYAIVPPGDPKALASALSIVINEGPLTCNWRFAFDEARRMFDLDVCVDTYHQIYSDLLL